jgi:hypothetical protein
LSSRDALKTTLQRNIRALYRYRAPVSAERLVLLEARERSVRTPSLRLLWEGLARGGVKWSGLPGNHFSILQLPARTELTELINKHCLFCARP